MLEPLDTTGQLERFTTNVTLTPYNNAIPPVNLEVIAETIPSNLKRHEAFLSILIGLVGEHVSNLIEISKANNKVILTTDEKELLNAYQAPHSISYVVTSREEIKADALLEVNP